MERKTNSTVLAETLEDLSKENFDKFCHQLLDRRAEPRVRRSRIENKSRLEVADVLVSTFTEARAVGVAVEILEKIGCNEEAKTLDSKTKGFVHQEEQDRSLGWSQLTNKKKVRSRQVRHRAKDKYHQLNQDGNKLVGFGKYPSMTLKGLYNSKRKDVISYVQYIRSNASTCTPGSVMEPVLEYVLRRDRQKAARANRSTTRKKTTRAKRVQNTRGQSTSASRPVKRTLERV